MKKWVSLLAAMLIALELCVPVMAADKQSASAEDAAVVAEYEEMLENEEIAARASEASEKRDAAFNAFSENKGFIDSFVRSEKTSRIQTNSKSSDELLYKPQARSMLKPRFFSLQQASVASVTIEHQPTRGTWQVSIGTPIPNTNTYEVYAREEFSASLGKHTTHQVGLAPGEYVLVMEYFDLDIPAGGMDIYSTLNTTATSNWEQESNNNYDRANKMKLNTPITGSSNFYRSSVTRDADWFAFTIPSNGVVNVNFKNEKSASGSWEYWLFADSPQKVFNTKGAHSYEYIKFPAGKTNHNSSPIGLKKGTYYIRIAGDNKELIGKQYKLTVGFTASKEWEVENNNTYKTADTMSVGRPKYGSSQGGSVAGWRIDNDWFKIKINSTKTYTFDFVNPKAKKGTWFLSLYNSPNNAKRNKRMTIKKFGKKGNDSISLNLKKGTYYIELTAFSDVQNNSNWSLTVNDPATKLKSFKLDKKTVTLRRNKTVVLKTTNFQPSNTPYRKGIWKSSRPDVATVDSNGRVRGLKKGTATITCTIGGKRASAKVVVR